MNSDYRSQNTFLLPLFLVLTGILTLIFCLVLTFRSLSSILIDVSAPEQVFEAAFIRIIGPEVAGEKEPIFKEVADLLDTAPLFMPSGTLFEELHVQPPQAKSGDFPQTFSEYPAEIQLDGAQFAVAARMAIPVTEAVDLGLRKLRETTVDYQTFGSITPFDKHPPLPKRACQLRITLLENGKSWYETINKIDDTDTLNPLWEPMILFAAIGASGIDAPPSPANTTGIETLDKKINFLAAKTMEKLPLPAGNYLIEVFP